MSNPNLEERVALLEQQVRSLLTLKSVTPGPMDWLNSFGMFSGDDLMKKIDAAGEAWRKQSRKAIRPAKKNRKRVKP